MLETALLLTSFIFLLKIMIIRNKHASQEIGVTDKFNQQIFLKPGEQVEVEDAQGKWYLANYSSILEKLDIVRMDDNEKDEKIATMSKQIETLTKLVERLTKGKSEDVKPEALDTEEKALVDENKTQTEDEIKERAELVEQLKLAWVKGVGNHWSTTKLREAKQKLEEIVS